MLVVVVLGRLIRFPPMVVIFIVLLFLFSSLQFDLLQLELNNYLRFWLKNNNTTFLFKQHVIRLITTTTTHINTKVFQRLTYLPFAYDQIRTTFTHMWCCCCCCCIRTNNYKRLACSKLITRFVKIMQIKQQRQKKTRSNHSKSAFLLAFVAALQQWQYTHTQDPTRKRELYRFTHKLSGEGPLIIVIVILSAVLQIFS